MKRNFKYIFYPFFTLLIKATIFQVFLQYEVHKCHILGVSNFQFKSGFVESQFDSTFPSAVIHLDSHHEINSQVESFSQTFPLAQIKGLTEMPSLIVNFHIC